MNRIRKGIFKITAPIFLFILFLSFFNGMADKGPSRKKFKVLGTSVEDLTQPQTAPKVVEDKLKSIVKDKRLNDWANWWKRCVRDLDLNSMEDLGEVTLYNEPTNFGHADEIKRGPGSMLYIKSPDGKRYIDPYWGRLVYVKENNEWQPYQNFDTHCGAELYEPSKKQAANILECYMHDGLDAAFWVNNDRIALMGYEAVTRQMSAECETVESCISPSIWIADLKSRTMSEYRGPVVKRGACDLGGYLKISAEKFFGKK